MTKTLQMGGGARIPRLTVEVGAKVMFKEYQGSSQEARRVPPPATRQMGPPKDLTDPQQPRGAEELRTNLTCEGGGARRRKRATTARPDQHLQSDATSQKPAKMLKHQQPARENDVHLHQPSLHQFFRLTRPDSVSSQPQGGPGGTGHPAPGGHGQGGDTVLGKE